MLHLPALTSYWAVAQLHAPETGVGVGVGVEVGVEVGTSVGADVGAWLGAEVGPGVGVTGFGKGLDLTYAQSTFPDITQ